MIQGPRAQGSTDGRHRAEGVLVRGTKPSLGSIGRECRASGVSAATRKPSATPNQGSTENAREESSEGVYISTIQLPIDRQAWVTTITGSTQLYPFHCTLHCCLTALLPCYLHLTYYNPSCCPLAIPSYYTGKVLVSHFAIALFMIVDLACRHWPCGVWSSSVA